MQVIARGTTPTIQIVFSTVQVEEIATAFLVVKQFNKNYIEKDISYATKDEEGNTMEFTLTQDETLTLKAHHPALIVCDWVLEDGTRGQSKSIVCDIAPPGKEEVI